MLASLPHEQTEQFLKEFLEKSRTLALDLALDLHRLPNWLNGAAIRFGWKDDSLIAVFENSIESDTFDFMGHIGSDCVVLFNVENFVQIVGRDDIKARNRFAVIMGEVGNSSLSNFSNDG